jgi:hypothetical protein
MLSTDLMVWSQQWWIGRCTWQGAIVGHKREYFDVLLKVGKRAPRKSTNQNWRNSSSRSLVYDAKKGTHRFLQRMQYMNC